MVSGKRVIYSLAILVSPVLAHDFFPENCSEWFDGCNTKWFDADGNLTAATEKFCEVKSKENCLKWHSKNDIQFQSNFYSGLHTNDQAALEKDEASFNLLPEAIRAAIRDLPNVPVGKDVHRESNKANYVIELADKALRNGHFDKGFSYKDHLGMFGKGIGHMINDFDTHSPFELIALIESRHDFAAVYSEFGMTGKNYGENELHSDTKAYLKAVANLKRLVTKDENDTAAASPLAPICKKDDPWTNPEDCRCPNFKKCTVNKGSRSEGPGCCDLNTVGSSISGSGVDATVYAENDESTYTPPTFELPAVDAPAEDAPSRLPVVVDETSSCGCCNESQGENSSSNETQISTSSNCKAGDVVVYTLWTAVVAAGVSLALEACFSCFTSTNKDIVASPSAEDTSISDNTTTPTDAVDDSAETQETNVSGEETENNNNSSSFTDDSSALPRFYGLIMLSGVFICALFAILVQKYQRDTDPVYVASAHRRIVPDYIDVESGLLSDTDDSDMDM